MATTDHDRSAPSPAGSLFLTTHWSVVLAASDKTSPRREEALERLCSTYWYAVYSYIRSSGYSPHDCQDLTQEFFARLLAKDFLKLVDPEKGKFRTFLKVAVKRFLSKEWERDRAQKRGGGQSLLPFDTVLAERWFGSEDRGAASPEETYDRRWALALLEAVSRQLKLEYEGGAGRNEFERLQAYLTAARGDIPYEELAVALEMSPGAVRVAIHRLRKRFRCLFREAVAETVSQPGELEEEMHHVISVLSKA